MIAEWLNTTFYGLDTAIYHAVGSLQSDWMNTLIHGITFFGSGDFMVPFTILCVILCFFKKTRKYGLVLVCAIVVGTLLTNVCLKPLIARPRPYVGMIGTAFESEYFQHYEFAGKVVESDYSFPSGHTNSAMEVVAALVTMMIRDKKRWAYWLIPWPFIMGFSRIYLFVHYPTDVFGGLLAGLVAGILGELLGAFLYDRINGLINRRKERNMV